MAEPKSAGSSAPVPSALRLRRASRIVEVDFPDGVSGQLEAELLRVYSPSAEVTGHSAGEGMLVTGKEAVAIDRIEPVGRYAVRIVFDDGHDTGLYTWPILHDLCRNREQKWQRYRDRLAAAAAGPASE